MSLTIAINRYFGRKEGQSLAEFAAEMKQLTDKDKQDFCEMLTPIMGEPVTIE